MNKTLGDSFHFERAGLRLKNRAVLAPLTHNMSGAGGDPGQAELDWLARCARGGFGLLIAAATQVQPGGRCWAGQPALMTDAQQQAFTALADSARQAGALAVVQLHHGGMRALPELNDGVPVGPCALAPGGRYPLGVKGLSEEEILTLIDAFVSAAERAHGAGLHGVELHAAHHFLLCNFLNPLHNLRTDRWGGSLANRARILVEIVRGIRARLPRGFLVGVRLSPESYAHIQGIELAHQLAVARLLADEGIDYLHFSMGDSFKAVAGDPDGGALLEAVRVGLAGRVPLMVAGKISDADSAERALAGGADLVAVGTAALGNPDWMERVSRGLPLHAAPFTAAHLTEVGFTPSALDYLASMGVLAPRDAA
ncbi:MULTISPECIES: NADH:flavin oxidoreductase [Aeromonas]|uniref:NADH:flavin oxidoreductase n=1 Tax=Aeromonas TaxID=642 RepID=UPI0005A96226|nr:NADH:flavin oxidoreductase [Aeromonas caviae]MBS4635359.1 NADH:flavin oxidoreductase [Aeromonas caviae]UCM50748.1 NADH:flavin oxidoreductase [Aeromonas caviae]WQD89672.1 NADH:flavin oxidoreductase [Aeromonas caviae]SQH58161.1 xenobiotic reductase B [Aeromonas caviae]